MPTLQHALDLVAASSLKEIYDAVETVQSSKITAAQETAFAHNFDQQSFVQLPPASSSRQNSVDHGSDPYTSADETDNESIASTSSIDTGALTKAVETLLQANTQDSAILSESLQELLNNTRGAMQDLISGDELDILTQTKNEWLKEQAPKMATIALAVQGIGLYAPQQSSKGDAKSSTAGMIEQLNSVLKKTGLTGQKAIVFMKKKS